MAGLGIAMVASLPERMTAIGFDEPGGPDVLVAKDCPVPEPGANQVLIKVSHAGVNRPDVIQRQGLYPPPPGASPLPGLEVSGVVVAIGEGAPPETRAQTGWFSISGGGYAEYCLAHSGHCLHVPDAMPMDEAAAIQELEPFKDVDGIHPYNLGKLLQGTPIFVPGTPAGIQQILLRNGHDPAGANVVVCGRSDIVGKPMALLLMQRADGANATVTVCHTRTKNLAEITRQADILVAAIGRPSAITADMVKEGAVVIDVGINRVDDASQKRGYRLEGDVDFDGVSKKASAITPVPGGVGPMTIAMLLENTLTATRLSSHGSGS